MNPQINLLHLKYFCDAVVYNSISEAAKMNFVSQSTVSQAIAKLEVSIGVPLVVHARHKFQLNENGKITFEQARHIFKAIQDIHDKINANEEMVTGTLKFASTQSLGLSFIAPSYRKMRQNYPKIDIKFELGNLNVIRNAIRKGDAEFAIVVYDSSFSTFNKITLRKGCFNLYKNREFPMPLTEDGILIDKKSGMHIDVLMKAIPGIHIQAELSGWEVVARFTEMNIGIGFFPDYLLENNRFPTLEKYPLELPTLDYEICAIYNKGVELSRASSTFLDQFSLE